jgi:hypothetical protein
MLKFRACRLKHMTHSFCFQNFARQHKLPIDEIAFEFEVMAGNFKEAPEEGAYIHGLYLEGCTWDEESKQLTESQPKVCWHICCHCLKVDLDTAGG